jgi:hypothetical protein
MTRTLRTLTLAAAALAASSCGNFITPQLRSVAAGNGRYVAVGKGGVIATSETLAKWAAAPSGVSANLNDVRYGNGKFVVVGDSGAVLVSTDGLTWTGTTTATGLDLFAVSFSATLSLWVAVGASGEVSTSPDGVSWTVRHTGSGWLSDVAASEAGFLAVEAGAAGELTSADGLTWTRAAVPLAGRCGVASGNGAWVSANYEGNLYRKPTQVSSAVWQTSATGMWTAGNDCDVAAGDGFFAVVDGVGTVFTSPDGTAWTQQFTAKNGLIGVVATGAELVAVGASGEVAHAQCPGGACGKFTEDQISVAGETPSGTSAGDGCAHWTCAGSKQCESVMGSASGVQCAFDTGQTCDQWCKKNIPGNCTCQ